MARRLADKPNLLTSRTAFPALFMQARTVTGSGQLTRSNDQVKNGEAVRAQVVTPHAPRAA